MFSNKFIVFLFSFFVCVNAELKTEDKIYVNNILGNYSEQGKVFITTYNL